MTSTPSQYELQSLVLGAIQRQTSPEDERRLRALLLTNDEALRMYVDYQHQHAALRLMLGPVFAHETPWPQNAHEGAAPAVPPAPRAKPVRAANAWYRPTLSLSLAFAAAAVTIMLGVMALVRHRAPDVARPEPHSPETSPMYVAKIIAVQDAVWRGPAPAELGAPLAAGSFRLESGVVDLGFSTGARVLIEGPAVFALDKQNQLRLELGQLVASVPRGARGFTVFAPLVEIVDLGTRFGVKVDGDHLHEVHVFAGSVQVRSHVEEDAGPRPAGSRVDEKLNAGEGARVRPESGELDRIPAQAERFTQAMPLPAEDRDAYYRAVMADNPVAYWRLRDRNSRQAADAAGAHVGAYLGGIRPAPRAAANEGDGPAQLPQPAMAHALNGKNGYVEVAHSARLNPDSFTVEAWVYWDGAEREHQSLVTSRDAMPDPQTLSEKTQIQGGKGNRGYFLYIEPAGHWAFLTGTETRYESVRGPVAARRQWVHVAATFARRAVNESGVAVGAGRLYIDGKLAGELEEMHYAPNRNAVLPLRIGAGATELNPPMFFLGGQIADVAIYDRALSEAQIAKHYSAMPSPATLAKDDDTLPQEAATPTQP